MPQIDRDADRTVSRKANEVDSQQDLIPFRRLASQVIRAELRNASLDQSDDIPDIFHDACLIVVKVSHKGRPIGNVKAYLLKVCRNVARRYMRKVIRMERLQERFPTDLVRAVHGEGYLSSVPSPEERPVFLEALPRLSARGQRIIRMMYIDELSDEEMRKILGLSPGAFRTAKHRAQQELLRELRKILRA